MKSRNSLLRTLLICIGSYLTTKYVASESRNKTFALN